MDVDNGGPNLTPENNTMSVAGVSAVVIFDVIFDFAANAVKVDVGEGNVRVVILIKDAHLTIAATKHIATFANFDTFMMSASQYRNLEE